MFATILGWLGNLLGGPFAKAAVDAYRAKLAAGNTSERIAADRVLHWFKMRRPGQHRGVPECASTLNTGAAARRWREATLAAAETVRDHPAPSPAHRCPPRAR